MNEVEANKALVLQVIEALGRLDAERFFACFAPDAIFETPGQHAAAGVKTFAQVEKEFPPLRRLLPEGIRFSVLSMTGEENRVHVELAGESRTIDGAEYNNRYHYAFVLRDGRVTRFRDYFDSDLVVRVLVPTMERFGATHLGSKS